VLRIDLTPPVSNSPSPAITPTIMRKISKSAESISSSSGVYSSQESLAPSPAESPSMRRRLNSRRVSWTDVNTGGKKGLVAEATFRREDEAWRCNKDNSGPLAPYVVRGVVPKLNATLPSSNLQMMARLKSTSVQLESIVYRDRNLALTVLCLSKKAKKKKFVRVVYSSNNWASSGELIAQLSPTSVQPGCFRFAAVIPVLIKSGNIQFMIAYDVDGYSYKDDNFSANYSAPINWSLNSASSTLSRPRPQVKYMAHTSAWTTDDE